MSFFAAVCVFLLFVLLLQRFINGQKQRKTLPPGPMGLPGVGNLLQLGLSPETTLKKWAKQYGKMFTISFGPKTAIVINDAQLMRECFNEPAFTGRMHVEMFELLTNGKYGVFSTDGQVWEEQRRFVMRQLRDYGFGRKTMESLVMDEVAELCDHFKSQVDQPFQIETQFSLAVVNALWTIMTGQRYSHKDPELKRIMDTFFTAFKSTNNSSNNWMVFAPWIKDIFPELSGWTLIKKSVKSFHGMYHKAIDEHKKTIVSGSPRDFIDAYLDQIQATDDPTSSFYGETGNNHLIGCLADFFLAGFLTSSTSLTLMMLFMAKFPEFQDKVYQEIVRVVGLSRVPSLADRPKMVYTEAVFLEILRFVSLIPLMGFHEAMSTKEFHGYVIPKGTTILVSSDGILHDPTIWEDPKTFNPDRFLETEGDSSPSLIKNDNLIAFSAGKRVCPGEKLAKDSVFLFTTNILQKFRVLENPKCPPSLEWDMIGVMRCAKPFTVILKDR